MSEDRSTAQPTGTGAFSGEDIRRRMAEGKGQKSAEKLRRMKEQHRGDYREPNYPFRIIPEVF